MANIKSAKKRILTDRRNAERNKAIKSRVKTAIKRVNAAIAANDKAAASTALVNAVKEITADTERDNFMGAEEALEYGIIDGIIANKNIN